MDLLTIKRLRVRRAGRPPGAAETLHELEWLGGEALVAPLPVFAAADDPRRAQTLPPRRDESGNEWLAF